MTDPHAEPPETAEPSETAPSSAPDPVINIVGATATGKSDLAVRLAQRLGGEIINADSMQFYRGMDIGTAKIRSEETAGIPHHLLDILDVTEDASVSDFQQRARDLIADMQSRGVRPILVGGSGLYVRAATDVMNFPGTDPQLRSRLEHIAELGGNRDLHELLTYLDPDAGAKIKIEDTRRIVRAVEVIALTGEPFSSHLPEYTYTMPTVQIGLRMNRDDLRARIAQRVHRMIDAGWLEEVESLLEAGIEESTTASAAIGYRQLIAYLRGQMSLDDAVEQTIIRTGQFAKRQETWFKRDPRIHWLAADAPDLFEQALDIITAAQEAT